MKMWIWYRCQNIIENYYHYDGEQLGFSKKVHMKTQSKKKDVLEIFSYIARNEWELIYFIKTVLKTTFNSIFNMEKVDLEES